MHELEERGKCQAPLFLSALGSSFVSQVVVGISCSFIMFFVSVMFVMVQGISIDGLAQFEKIVTDIYKMLQQICSKGMVKGIWYFFVLVI